MTRVTKSWRVFGVVGALAAMAAAGTAGATETQHKGLRTGSGAAVVDPHAYAVMYAVRDGSGYDLYPVNARSLTWCQDGQDYATGATYCYASRIDFTPMNLASDAQRRILRDVGSSSQQATLAFSGKIVNGTFQVWQVWRSPAQVPTSARFYAISHDTQSTLIVNDWLTKPTKAVGPLGDANFIGAPALNECFTTPGGTCPDDPGYHHAAVEYDLTTVTGTLVAGSGSGASFRVTSYFLPISVGVTQSNDGYSYCETGQSLCGPTNNQCTFNPPSCPMVHGRIRGLVDYANPNPDVSFQDWQLATGQLTQADVTPSP